MTTVFAFILVLGLLIFVHELGHFLLAKATGVRVLKFSLGFGPTLVGKTIGETEYVISAFPLGGFVKMFGENPDEQEIDPAEQSVSFAHKKVWQRFAIVSAGPIFNFLFTLVLFFCLFLIMGVPNPVDSSKIGRVNSSSPAAEAGLKAGDIIREINGTAVSGWEGVLNGVKSSGGNPLTMRVDRQGQDLTFQVNPQIDNVKNLYGEIVDKRYMIGIVKDDEVKYVRGGLVDTFLDACGQTWMYCVLTVTGFVKIVQRVVPASEIGGPILIAQIAGQQMKAGWINLLYFMGLLSVNLGVLNLLPVPVLDGGHLLFLSIEAIRKKPMAERAQIIAQQIGIALLGTLMVFVFYNDIMRFFR